MGCTSLGMEAQRELRGWMDQDLERCRSAIKIPMSTSAEESSVTFGDDGGWGECERQVWMMVEGGIARSHPSASSSQAIGVRFCEAAREKK